jgi:hypothetical protein
VVFCSYILSLSHSDGIAGNAYCFLYLYRLTRCARELNRAIQFAKFAMSKLSELRLLPDHPYSLFEGMAGFVAFVTDLTAAHPSKATFPAFEL